MHQTLGNTTLTLAPRNDGARATLSNSASASPGVRVRSEALLAGGREVVIEHRGQNYLLRLTSSGKLILTK